ncbi:ORF6N domain-containing protein [Escherichia coli]|nr:ORF6N domain-containing protein [Escherichia coli]
MQQSTSTAVNLANYLPTVDPDTFPVIEWNGVRVVTTETLARGYNTEVNNIRNNLLNNKGRFVEGVHIFKLDGGELKSFKNYINDIDVVNKRAPSLTLWTEKGAARMSKIIDTDEAWDFFEQMETAYFHPVQHMLSHGDASAKVQMHMMLNESAARMLNLPQTGKLQMLRKTFEHYGVPDTLPSYGIDAPNEGGSSEVTFSLTHLLKASGVSLSAASVNKLLQKNGIIQKMKRASSKGGEKEFWNITESGLRFGKNVTSDRNPRETQPHFYKSQFGKLLATIGI